MKYAIILLILMMVVATSTFAEVSDVLRTVTVKGNAEIMVVPDEVVVKLGVDIFKVELSEAKAENDRIVSAVLDAVKKAGVSTEHVKTDYLHIHPKYRDTNVARTFLGYSVRQSISVTVTEVDRFEEILSSALEAGANQLHGVEFRSSNPRKYMDEARALALVAAKEKADAMATQYGQKVGRPISISEDPGTRSYPSALNAMRTSGTGSGTVEGTMVAGRIAINAKVSVKFELLD